MSKKLVYPPGAVKAQKEFHGLPPDAYLWAVCPAWDAPLKRPLNSASGYKEEWNVGGEAENKNFRRDFVFLNYWHAYAYWMKVKGR